MTAAVDDVFRALADPSRRLIVERLSDRPMSVSELARPLAMSMPAVLQHLAVMQSAGLIGSTKRGRVRMCTLRPDSLSLVQDWISARHADWNRRLDLLSSYLEESPDA